jgi:hypothetical protein
MLLLLTMTACQVEATPVYSLHVVHAAYAMLATMARFKSASSQFNSARPD